MSHGLLPLPASDKLRAYAVYCDGMQGKLSRCQGWDAQLQRQGFEQSFADGTLFWYRHGGQEVALVSLSRRPYGLHIHLLVVLAQSPGRVLSRDQIMDALKGHPLEAFDRSIDVHISRIRALIEDDPKNPKRVLTVRGVGYLFARKQDGSIDA